MKLKIIFSLIFLLGVSIFAQSARLNESAPDFRLKDSNGKEHSLRDFKGKVVVLEWINYDCPFVKKHYDSKNMQSLQEKYTAEGVIWLAICSSAPGKQGNFSPDEINKRSKNHNAKFTAYLIDEDGKVGKMYGAKTTPHIYIIDKDGKLVYAGGIDDKASTDVNDIKTAKNYISTALDEILEGKKVSVQSSTPYGCSVKY
ncbi:MAG: thioredoxin family protein [Ignavibacterium album]|jgi:peroxiredoxin|uniref:thioredoxin family protein n=1 Tax=Ignavibacterium album TaxID=591197 RepID=UPI0026F06C6B|nr:thioredoxin family protein [Ignavibacterium album]MCX8106208.1 thioredoxin family protein [Ignavibacterium album]